MKVSLERPCFSGIRDHDKGEGYDKEIQFVQVFLFFVFVFLFFLFFFLFFFLTNDPPFLERREDSNIYKKTVTLQNIEILLSL